MSGSPYENTKIGYSPKFVLEKTLNSSSIGRIVPGHPNMN